VAEQNTQERLGEEGEGMYRGLATRECDTASEGVRRVMSICHECQDLRVLLEGC